jgi:hypothetical protein
MFQFFGCMILGEDRLPVRRFGNAKPLEISASPSTQITQSAVSGNADIGILLVLIPLRIDLIRPYSNICIDIAVTRKECLKFTLCNCFCAQVKYVYLFKKKIQ